MDLNTLLSSGKYLPKPLRDFHDAKEVFKTIHATISSDNESIKPVNWVNGQCYVIDIFLWFMAARGWTMQRSRAKVEFKDLNQDIEARRAAESHAFREMLAERKEKWIESETKRENT